MARVPNRRTPNKARMATRSIRNRGYGIPTPIISITADDISNTISCESETTIHDLNYKKIKLLAQKSRLRKTLNENHFTEFDLSQLSKIFNNLNTSELNKINDYHKSIVLLLQEEIDEEIQKIDLLIEEIDDEIESISLQNDIDDSSNIHGYSKIVPNKKNDSISVTINPVINGTDIAVDENLLNSLRKEIKRLKASERKSYLTRLVYLAQVENIYKALEKNKKNNED